MGNHPFLTSLIGKYVKVQYKDENETKVIRGILNEVCETYIVVNDVIIGLGSNFIACIPQENNRREF